MYKKVVVHFRTGEPLEIGPVEEINAPNGEVKFRSIDQRIKYEIVGENVNYIVRHR